MLQQAASSGETSVVGPDYGKVELVAVALAAFRGPAAGGALLHTTSSAAGATASAVGGSPDLAGKAPCLAQASSSGDTSADGPDLRSSSAPCPFVGAACSHADGSPDEQQQSIASRINSCTASMQQGTREESTVVSAALCGTADSGPVVHLTQSLAAVNAVYATGVSPALAGESTFCAHPGFTEKTSAHGPEPRSNNIQCPLVEVASLREALRVSSCKTLAPAAAVKQACSKAKVRC
jgi:hypothetical protein